MRTLNDYFIPMGQLDLGGAADTTNIITIPDGGEIVGVSYNTSEAIDVAGTADILIDGAEVSPAVDIDFPATVVDIGGLARPDAKIYVANHASVQLQSNDEPATGIFECTLIIRR